MREGLMTDVFPPPADFVKTALIDAQTYDAMYARSLSEPEAFWSEQAQSLDWMVPFTKVKNTSFDEANFSIKWFEDGVLNVSVNCVDRHLVAQPDKVAILWEGDDPADSKAITYRELHREMCKMANVMKKLGVVKGDRVTLYMPMIPEAAYAMLACTRIGAIHSIVFGGFSPDSLANRIQDCDSKLVITADEGLRGGKPVPLKANTDVAVDQCACVQNVLMITRTGAAVTMKAGRDVRYEDIVVKVSDDCSPEPMGAEDPLFILYTSGSTGKPKEIGRAHV